MINGTYIYFYYLNLAELLLFWCTFHCSCIFLILFYSKQNLIVDITLSNFNLTVSSRWTLSIIFSLVFNLLFVNSKSQQQNSKLKKVHSDRNKKNNKETDKNSTHRRSSKYSFSCGGCGNKFYWFCGFFILCVAKLFRPTKRQTRGALLAPARVIFSFLVLFSPLFSSLFRLFQLEHCVGLWW